MLLIVLSVFFASKNQLFFERLLSNPAPTPLSEYVDACLKKTIEEGVITNSLQGGYYDVPEPNSNQLFVKIPYYFDYFGLVDSGQKKFPTKETMENELEKYVIAELPTCLNNFSPFKEQGYEIEAGEINPRVSMEKEISVNVKYPIKATKGDSVFWVDKFYYSVKVDFAKVYSIMSETISEQEKNPNYVPIGYISLAALENNFKYELSYLKEDVVVYTYIFEDYLLEGKNYTFIFAIRYDWQNLKAEGGSEIDIINISEQTCYVGDICNYNLNIYNEELDFEDYTSMFDISKDGIIKFIPSQGDIGKHDTLIKVSNNDGKEKYITVALEIIPFNNQPKIEEIPNQKAKVGQIFNYQVISEEPDNDVFVFLDDTELFDISYDGLINFIPEKKDIGMHIIKITISDGKLEDNKWMYLTIEG